MHRPGFLVLTGNGLSIAHNPDLQLSKLTEQFLSLHREEAGLKSLMREMGIEPEKASHDFEIVIGAIEAAEGVIEALMELAAESPLQVLHDAADVLRKNDVPLVLRHLYYSYCAQVLAAIGELSRSAISKPVLGFGEWVKQMHKAHFVTSVFTLNYDVLVERMFVADDLLGLKGVLTDCFSGIADRRREIELVPGTGKVACGLFFPYDAPNRSIYLHHLHGCLTHFEDRQTGEVLKVDSADVRKSGVFEFLAKQPGRFVPAIILGSRKVEKSTRKPFEFAFESLREALRSANVICIAGYSFRDIAVNELLKAAAEARSDRRWIVIDKRSGDADEFRAKVEEVLPITSIEWYLNGFEEPLPTVNVVKAAFPGKGSSEFRKA